MNAIFLKKVVDMFWWFAELLYLCTRKRETRALTRGSESLGSTVLWHNSIDRNCSTRENKYEPSFWKEMRYSASSDFFIPYYITEQIRNSFWRYFYKVPRNEGRTKLAWVLLSDDGSSYKIFGTKILYNEEFDPGSGWTLATGLTHASRGAAWK